MAIQTSLPGKQGVDAGGVLGFIDAIEEAPDIEPHGLIIQRHGKRIVEAYWRPHDRGRSRLLYSLSKTFTGTALALQIGEGRLSLEDRVSDYLPELFDTADDGLRDLRIRHIASMATGHNRETWQEARERDPRDAVRGFLQIPPDAEPGTLFAYNQPPVLTLATILQRLAGESLTAYLRPRLFDPLGIGEVSSRQYRPGIDYGFSGIYTSLDAVARLGQLYLDDGKSDGRRLLPEGWVSQASSVQVANPANIEPDWRQGYGFQLWMSRHGYRGDGACGQYMVVLPEYDAVIAMFSCTANMQAVLDLMWTHLLPAMANEITGAEKVDVALADRLESLALPTAAARYGGHAPGALSGSFRVAPGAKSHSTIDSIDLQGSRMLIHEGESTLSIPLSMDWTPAGDFISASAAQSADGCLNVDLVFLATPHRLEINVNPEAGTFVAQWPLMPLFGAGIDKPLSGLHAPR